MRRPSEGLECSEIESPYPCEGLLGRLAGLSADKDKLEGKKVITYDRHREEDIREQDTFNHLIDEVRLRMASSKQTLHKSLPLEVHEPIKHPLQLPSSTITMQTADSMRHMPLLDLMKSADSMQTEHTENM